ncbi:MAG: hypothetical protein ACTHK1_06725 [Actinomycetales bacterium]
MSVRTSSTSHPTSLSTPHLSGLRRARRLPLFLAGALTVGGLSLVALTEAPARAAGTTSTAAAVTAIAPAAATGATTSSWARLNPSPALLAASQMPKVNSVQRWTATSTRATFVSYQPQWRGQLHAARQDFRVSGGRAISAVFTFPTEAKAKAAAADLLDVTRSELRRHLPRGAVLLYGPAKVTKVAVPSGMAGYTSLVSKPSAASIEGSFEWLGVTQRGRAMSVVVWRVGGQDATYEVDPTIAALKAANTRLARLR